MFKHSLITVSALATLVAAPAMAQQPQRGHMRGMMGPQMMQQHGMMMGGGMMGMMSQVRPAMLLQASDQLGLTEEQVESLTELRERSAQEHQALMQAAMNARQKASSALEGDSPDLDAYARAVNEAADRMADAHVAMAQTALDAKAVLTEEQRERLSDAMSLMRTMGGGMTGGMMHGGMMHGGG